MPPFLELLPPLAAWALTTHLYDTDSSPQFTPEETEAWRGGGVYLGSEGTAVVGQGPELSSRPPAACYRTWAVTSRLTRVPLRTAVACAKATAPPVTP